MPEEPLSRRPSPILLVIPIVLALAGVGLSVMLYLRLTDKSEGTLAKEREAQRKLADARQKYDAVVDRLGAMRAVLGYDASDFQRWLEEDAIPGHADVKRALAARQAESAGLEGTAGTLRQAITAADQQIAAVQTAKTQMNKAKRAEADQKRQDFENVDRAFPPQAKGLLDRLTEAGQTLAEKADEVKRIVAEREETKRTQDDTLIAIQSEVERLEDALSARRGLTQRVDGHVVSVLAGTDRLTVDIGRQERVRPGTRFTIYEKGQIVADPKNPDGAGLIPENAVGKAEIEILRVFERQSRAVVLNLDLSKPILSGDAICNPGFDPTYRTVFVVVGQVDLTGDGRPDDELLQRLIASIGGVIEGDVSIRTDFLLMGGDWPKDDPELRKRYYRDQDCIKAAEDLDISFLNVRRFLDYAGVRVDSDGVARPIEGGT